MYASFHAFRVSMVDKGLITAIVGASLRKPQEKHMKHCLDSIELATGKYLQINTHISFVGTVTSILKRDHDSFIMNFTCPFSRIEDDCLGLLISP